MICAVLRRQTSLFQADRRSFCASRDSVRGCRDIVLNWYDVERHGARWGCVSGPASRSGQGCVAALNVLQIFTNQTQKENKEACEKRRERVVKYLMQCLTQQLTSRRHYLFSNPNDKGWESVDGPVQGWRLKALLAVRMTQPF